MPLIRTPLLLLASALATAASAQSAGPQSPSPFSPVLFGVVDLNLRAVKNGSASTLKSLGTDGLTSSRIGFRGVEDLGDGLKAGFWLEAPLSADTGTANATRFWNRRATVSLIQPTLGELRLGRDNTPLFNAFNLYDPFGTNGLGELLGNGTSTGIVSALGSGANTLSRSDNQASWFSPGNLGGAYWQLSASPSEGTNGSRYVAGRLGIAAKHLDASVGYAQTRVVLGDSLKQALIGASYDFEVVKLSGQVLQSRYTSVAGGARKQRVYQLGAYVPVAERHIFRLDAIHGDMKGGAAGSGFADADDANQFAAGYEYKMSKRTSLYTVASMLRNKGASRLTVAAGNPGMKPGENSRGFDLGVRHSF